MEFRRLEMANNREQHSMHMAMMAQSMTFQMRKFQMMGVNNYGKEQPAAAASAATGNEEYEYKYDEYENEGGDYHDDDSNNN